MWLPLADCSFKRLAQVVPVNERPSRLACTVSDAALAGDGEHEEAQLVAKQDEHLTAGKAAFWDVVELYRRMWIVIAVLLLCNLFYYGAWSYCVPNLFCKEAIKNARVRHLNGRALSRLHGRAQPLQSKCRCCNMPLKVHYHADRRARAKASRTASMCGTATTKRILDGPFLS